MGGDLILLCDYCYLPYTGNEVPFYHNYIQDIFRMKNHRNAWSDSVWLEIKGVNGNLVLKVLMTENSIEMVILSLYIPFNKNAKYITDSDNTWKEVNASVLLRLQSHSEPLFSELQESILSVYHISWWDWCKPLLPTGCHFPRDNMVTQWTSTVIGEITLITPMI